MLTVTVSGSFHRFMPEIERAVQELMDAGIQVLSPSYPKVVDHVGEFLFVASDRVRSIKMVQDRHLACIEASDFLWLICPTGYVGQSASMELGFAVARDVPVFSSESPYDLTLRQYVRKVKNLAQGIYLASKQNREKPQTFLVDPYTSIEAAHRQLERIRTVLNKPASRIDDTSSREITSRRRLIGKLVGGPA
jgi:hypothetical protein